MSPNPQFTQESIAEVKSVTREGDTINIEIADTMTHTQASDFQKYYSSPDIGSFLADTAAIDNPENKKMIVEAQSIVAQQLLAAEGWSILKQLFLLNSEALQTTQLFVLPVIAEEELVRTTLGEHYEEFAENFNALKEDLATMSSVLLALSKRHEGKEGAVTEDEQALVAELTMGYSKIQTQMETQVGPELMKQMSILEAGGVDADILYRAFVAGQETSE
jgi:hypothetical protein